VRRIDKSPGAKASGLFYWGKNQNYADINSQYQKSDDKSQNIFCYNKLIKYKLKNIFQKQAPTLAFGYICM